MAFDSERMRLVVFGGNSGNAAGVLNDTWEYDPVAGTWTPANLEGDAPEPRSRHEAAFAADFGAAFFFGGVSRGLTNELLMLSSPPVPRVQIAPAGVVNALSGRGGAVAPGEIVSVFGSGLGPEAGVPASFDPETGSLPVSLAGVSVSVNRLPAPIYFASSGQVNIQIPYEVAGQDVALIDVTYGGETSTPARLPIAEAAPGLFPTALNEDGTLNSPENPAAPEAT